MSILEKILAQKRNELAASGRNLENELEASPLFRREIFPLTEYISDNSKTGIIAEFKRKSPSKGIINGMADIREVTSGFCRHGASAISVLTDNKFFGGSITDLILARETCNVPILRKDFIIDEFQILEARAIGADAVLLIASALGKSRISQLARFARSIDLQVLLELHSDIELNKLNEYVNIVGVNNRDLRTFNVDTSISLEMAGMIPLEFIKISESGLSSPDTIKELKEAGYNGFLMGEYFMKNSDPVNAFSEFCSKLI